MNKNITWKELKALDDLYNLKRTKANIQDHPYIKYLLEEKCILDKKPDNIKVIISDDGIGRQKAMELKSKQVLKKKSYGLQITESRISILNKTQSSKTTLKIHDLKDQAGNALGTKIELIIPIQTLNENYD